MNNILIHIISIVTLINIGILLFIVSRVYLKLNNAESTFNKRLDALERITVNAIKIEIQYALEQCAISKFENFKKKAALDHSGRKDHEENSADNSHIQILKEALSED